MIIDLSQVPDWLKSKWDGRTRTITIHGEEYEFLVVSRALEPAPRFFSSYNLAAGHPPFISDEVPPDWQAPMMAHEIYEMVFLDRRPHRCARALEFELGYVPPKQLEEYLKFRAFVLAQLMDFMTGETTGIGYSDEQRAMVAETLSYCRFLHSKIKSTRLQFTA